jgi:CBS domain-containing protein
MTSPVLTLPESGFTDPFSVIHVLQQHHIRHLPIVDGQGDLVGLLTHETLRQVLQPTDLLRLRLVQEVMTPTVSTVAPTDALLRVAQRMATQRVSSVVVVGNDGQGAVPMGIVTERDLVQFQALELEPIRKVGRS